MSAILKSASVTRVREALAAAGIDAEIVELPGAARTARQAAARTARQAADFLGCDVAQIANSLVFRTARDEPLLVMSSGARRVDVERLANIVGDPVGKADADFVRQRTGFAIGGVAPVGHTAPVRTFVDESLAAYRDLWAAAGHPHTVFRLSYADLVRITGGVAVKASA